MRCTKIQDLLFTDYLDGRLSSAVKEKIDDHIKVCPDCRELFSVLESTRRDLRNEPVVNAPEYLWHRITSNAQAIFSQ